MGNVWAAGIFFSLSSTSNANMADLSAGPGLGARK